MSRRTSGPSRCPSRRPRARPSPARPRRRRAAGTRRSSLRRHGQLRLRQRRDGAAAAAAAGRGRAVRGRARAEWRRQRRRSYYQDRRKRWAYQCDARTAQRGYRGGSPAQKHRRALTVAAAHRAGGADLCAEAKPGRQWRDVVAGELRAPRAAGGVPAPQEHPALHRDVRGDAAAAQCGRPRDAAAGSAKRRRGRRRRGRAARGRCASPRSAAGRDSSWSRCAPLRRR